MTAATQTERDFLKLVNQTRQQAGLAPLQLETHLNQSADKHSAWMLDWDVFSHTGARGSAPLDRIEATGFDLDGSWRVAENLGYVSVNENGSLQDEIRALHQALMDSPAHRANILDKDFDLVGIGLQLGWLTIQGQSYRVLMVTQNFAYTGGDYALDIAPGVTISTTTAPDDAVAGPAKGQWRPLYDGETFQAQSVDSVTSGTSRNDALLGSAGADDLRGGAGRDWISGDAGNDRIDGGQGDDFLSGGGGRDLVLGGAGNDLVAGGMGDDRIIGGRGGDSLRGDGGNDRLDGGTGNDRLGGGDGADILIGGVGADLLSGGGGADTLRGGDGPDVILGGGGNDALYGGGGADSFVFHRKDGVDRIHDYEAGQDRILIDGALLGEDVAGFVEHHLRETSFGLVIELGPSQRIELRQPGLHADDVADDIFLI